MIGAVGSLLRRFWNRPRVPAPSRVWRDWVLVVALIAGVVIEAIARAELHWPIISAAVGVTLALTLLWRRTHPLPMVLIAFGAMAALDLAERIRGLEPVELYSSAGALILIYALVRWGAGREIVVGLAVVVASATISLVAKSSTVTDAVGGACVLAAAIAIGAGVRARASSRALEAEQHKLQERARIARDLHDTVAHHVSAIAVRAQAGLVTSASDPDATRDALRVIEVEASQALREMRSMVGVLRTDDAAALAPAPGLAQLAQLASTEGGVEVSVEIDGSVGDLSASAATALFRIAQESVTNARRHARELTRVHVKLDGDATAVTLTVSDDGSGGTDDQASSTGFGITGMTERARLLGGSLTSGTRGGRGWTVCATLPRNGAVR